jgi:hypothetical protein
MEITSTGSPAMGCGVTASHTPSPRKAAHRLSVASMSALGRRAHSLSPRLRRRKGCRNSSRGMGQGFVRMIRFSREFHARTVNALLTLALRLKIDPVPGGTRMQNAGHEARRDFAK